VAARARSELNQGPHPPEETLPLGFLLRVEVQQKLEEVKPGVRSVAADDVPVEVHKLPRLPAVGSLILVLRIKHSACRAEFDEIRRLRRFNTLDFLWRLYFDEGLLIIVWVPLVLRIE